MIEIDGNFGSSTYPSVAGVLVVGRWSFGRWSVWLLYASHASHIMYRRPSLPYITLIYRYLLDLGYLLDLDLTLGT